MVLPYRSRALSNWPCVLIVCFVSVSSFKLHDHLCRAMIANKMRTVTSMITATNPRKPGGLMGSNRLYGADFLGVCNCLNWTFRFARQTLQGSHTVPLELEKKRRIHVLCFAVWTTGLSPARSWNSSDRIWHYSAVQESRKPTSKPTKIALRKVTHYPSRSTFSNWCKRGSSCGLGERSKQRTDAREI